MKYIIASISLFFLLHNISYSQCCAGGSGCPIVGGMAEGVLSTGQFELNTNYQYISSDKFYKGSSPDSNKYFDQYSSTYQYFRLAYGLTKKFMISLESGYYFNKKEIGLNNDPSRTYSSKGISDLIIFPRYNVFTKSSETSKTELTVGLGIKLPIGSYNDSTGVVEPFSGNTFYLTNPQAIQLTSGAKDIIYYLFLFQGYPKKNLRLFCNAMHISKGWNPLGEKIGDFTSLSLFANTTLYKKLSGTLQVRGEYLGNMKLNEDILLYSYPNYDPAATGYKKVFVSPQLSYSINKFSFYGTVDIPVYQNVVKTQVGTKIQASVGVSYRFNGMKEKKTAIELGGFVCPMHPEITSSFEADCPKCGMPLEN